MNVWNEATIARCLAKGVFKSQYIAVPRCWQTGHECDLLVVTRSLRVVDVEVKISRADFKADARKDKWWHHRFGSEPVHRDWPPSVWKHYYAIPAKLWDDELRQFAGSTKSGIILLGNNTGSVTVSEIRRHATPNSNAPVLNAHDMLQLARAAGFRMWDAMHELDVNRSRQQRRRFT